jgi:dolichol-phosphate mannosyltransferase
MDRPLLSVVVPAFNESPNIPALLEALVPVAEKYAPYEIVFVDDGSLDDTLEVIRRQQAINPSIAYVSFSRNFGHQAALRAGLAHARGRCVVSMDADLQHPPELIHEMMEHWKAGFDVVFTVRQDGPGVSWFKRKTSAAFYRLMNALGGVTIEPGAADFRLLSRPVVDALNELVENPLFLRGMLPWLGFRHCRIAYTPGERFRGSSKYTLRKMAALATDGVTSFSVRPLALAAAFGAIVSAGAFAYSIYALCIKLFTDRAIAGWTSVLVAVLWLGGIQLLALGIIGEYLGKLFLQSKRRPFYVVRDASFGPGAGTLVRAEPGEARERV